MMPSKSAGRSGTGRLSGPQLVSPGSHASNSRSKFVVTSLGRPSDPLERSMSALWPCSSTLPCGFSTRATESRTSWGSNSRSSKVKTCGRQGRMASPRKGVLCWPRRAGDEPGFPSMSQGHRSRVQPTPENPKDRQKRGTPPHPRRTALFLRPEPPGGHQEYRGRAQNFTRLSPDGRNAQSRMGD